MRIAHTPTPTGGDVAGYVVCMPRAYMDEDLKDLDRQALLEEVVRLRASLRADRDSSVAVRRRAPATSLGAVAVGAAALGACALGALAIGALAIGRVAIGRLVLKQARAHAITVDELTIGRLHIRES